MMKEFSAEASREIVNKPLGAQPWSIWTGLDIDDDTVIRKEPDSRRDQTYGWWRLQAVKANMRRLFELEGSLMVRVVTLIRLIEEEGLYTQEADAEGRPYRSMNAYLPDLLEELKQAGWVHKLGVRQLRAYLAAYRVMVDGLKYTPDELSYIGIGRATELLEATDYDPKTGVIAEEPKPGKIGRKEFKELADKMKMNPDAWPIKSVRAELNESRGISPPWVKFNWEEWEDGLSPNDIVFFDGEETHTFDLTSLEAAIVWPKARVLKMLRLMNVMHNLTEE